MNPWLIAGLCFSPSALLGAVVIGVFVCERRRDYEACKRIVVLTERDVAERMRSGAAWVEAYALQLDEILALPEADTLTLARRFL